jgi:nucleotide-binding universal stress UspA family protein
MNILYATDGSECAATAGRLLAAWPLPEDTRVTVLSAVPPSFWLAPPPYGVEASVYPMLAEVAAQEEKAARQTAEAAATSFQERGHTVTVKIRRESPTQAILEQADQDGSELIGMGSHGMGAIERFLVGSVSERVARHAPCSVLVARSDRIEKVVVAVDDSEASEHALAALARLPLPAGLTITVVHVLRPNDLMPPMQLGHGLSRDQVVEAHDQQRLSAGDQILRHAAARLHAAGREATPDLRCGAAADEVIAAARGTSADLIVVGAANKSALGRLFLGSVSARVLSHAPCSVLIARSK